jgi:hypothetical protein
MSSALQRWVVASSLVLCACSEDARSSSSKGAHEHDAAMPVVIEPSPLPPCMWTLDACADHIEWRIDTLLQADDVDADARFIAIGGQAVGVASGAAGLKSVARVHMVEDRDVDRCRRWLDSAR